MSTIHTNNALATVERLLDMNVERYLLSTALTGIISQRLAKMLCPDCRFQRETTPYEKKVFKKFIHMDVPMIWEANPKGCDHCRRGYHGRIAFHEVLELDDDIRNALNIEGLEKKELAKMVYTGKTITMLQDALIKCYEGQTSFEEVYRNIEIETEDDEEYESEIGEFLKDVTPPSPEGEDTEEEDSDELIDTIVNKNDKNNISNMMSTPVFTASDFNDTPVENANTSDKVQQNVQKVVSSQGVTVPKQVQNTITNSTPNPQIGAMVSNTKPTQTAVTIPNDFRTSQGVTATIPTTNVQNNYNQSVAKIPDTTKTQQYPAGSLINTNSVKTVATTPVTTPTTVPTTYQAPTTAAPINVPITYQNPATVPVTAPVTSPATSPSYGTAVNNIYKMPTINPQPITPNVQVQTTIAPTTSSNAYSNTGYTYNVGQVSSVTPTSSNTNTGGTLVNINGMPRLDDKAVPLVPKI